MKCFRWRDGKDKGCAVQFERFANLLEGHRLEPKSQALSRFKRPLENQFSRGRNSLWMLSPITATMELFSSFETSFSTALFTFSQQENYEWFQSAKKKQEMKSIRSSFETPYNFNFWRDFPLAHITKWVNKEITKCFRRRNGKKKVCAVKVGKFRLCRKNGQQKRHRNRCL